MNTLSRRISKLEKSVTDDEDDDHLSQLISNLRNKEKKKKKDNYKVILDHFENDIAEASVSITPNNILAILVFSIKYVESNADRVSSYLSVKNSGEYKKQLAVSFCKHCVEGFDDEILESMTDTLVGLLFPKPTVEELVPEKEKFSFFKRKK